jgi:hypothetical protein
VKTIFDKTFRYTDALNTDVSKTIARVRKEQERAKREAEDAQRQLDEKVKSIGLRK